MYGCETWSLTPGEEHRLRVFENRVLRSIFGPKGDEIIRRWGEPNNEVLHYLHSSTNIIRMAILKRSRGNGIAARIRIR
jgi:hypothetical protein